MRKRMIAAFLAVSMTLGMSVIAGCSGGSTGTEVNADIPAGAPPLMPENHQGRFEDRGAAGCYGCHGANDQANPMLNGAVALPDDHYANSDADTRTVDPTHDQCITCHGQV